MGSKYHIITDLQCQVLHFGKEVCIATPGEDACIELLKGRHLLSFVSTENPADSYKMTFEVPESGIEDFIEVKLFPVRQERIEEEKKAEEERQRLIRLEEIRREEEQRKKKEEEERQTRLRKEAERQRLAEEERARQKRIIAEALRTYPIGRQPFVSVKAKSKLNVTTLYGKECEWEDVAKEMEQKLARYKHDPMYNPELYIELEEQLEELKKYIREK